MGRGILRNPRQANPRTHHHTHLLLPNEKPLRNSDIVGPPPDFRHKLGVRRDFHILVSRLEFSRLWLLLRLREQVLTVDRQKFRLGIVSSWTILSFESYGST